jgi:hypothetical protein
MNDTVLYGIIVFAGHAQCVEFVKSFDLPMLVLGGGGYTVRNVARCWTYETSVLLNNPISNTLPYNDFYEYYAPDFKLHLTPVPTMENKNSPERLQNITNTVLQNLKHLTAAPSVQMQAVPPDFVIAHETQQSRDDAAPDRRDPRGLTSDGAERRSHPAEFFASEEDQDSGASRRIGDALSLASSGTARPGLMTGLGVKPQEAVAAVFDVESENTLGAEALGPSVDDPLSMEIDEERAGEIHADATVAAESVE